VGRCGSGRKNCNPDGEVIFDSSRHLGDQALDPYDRDLGTYIGSRLFDSSDFVLSTGIAQKNLW